MGPKQRDIRDRLDLPVLTEYPVPPRCGANEPNDVKWLMLLQTYQDFAIELHTGIHLTQLFHDSTYITIHCQLMEDLQTLKLDQSNGRIIEFPLTSVSKVYRAMHDEARKWPKPLFAAGLDHVVVMEFMRRRLAFVFKESLEAQNFIMCLELLIRRAQQLRKRTRAEAEMASKLKATWESDGIAEQEPSHVGAATCRGCCAPHGAPGTLTDETGFMKGMLKAL